MKKFLCLFAAICMPVLMYIQTAKADTVLFFAPTRVEIVDSKPVQEIRVTNMSKIKRSYSVSLENIVMTVDGITTRVDTFDYSAKRMLRVVPRHFDINPGERQIIRLMARFPEGTEDGEYHAHIEFLENTSKRAELNPNLSAEAKARANAEIAYVTAIPVIVTKGNVQTGLEMRNVQFARNEKTGKPQIEMILERKGNGQGNAIIETDYIAPDGTVKSAGVKRNVYIYREIDYRKNVHMLELLDDSDLAKGGQIRVKLYNKNISETEPVDTITVKM